MADTRAHRGIQNPAYRPTVFSLGTVYVPGAIYIIYICPICRRQEEIETAHLKSMFNLDHIWSINEQKLSPWRNWTVRLAKRMVIVKDSITKNNLTSHASALTYNSILA